MSQKKYSQILIRFNSNEEIELINQFKSLFVTKNESFNKYLKSEVLLIIRRYISDYDNKKVDNKIQNESSKLLEEVVIPRFYGMIKANNEKNLIKIELLNRKVNFLINELGLNRLIDGKPVINNINEKVKEKNWMLEEEVKINDELQIKKS